MPARNGEIELQSGGTIECRHITQWLTYGGLIEGVPTSQRNRQSIERLLRQERERSGRAAYLVPPRVRSVPWLERPTDAEMLPGITCVAHFKSFRSWLIIVWFQDAFAFPIDERVVAHIAGLDFGRLTTVEDEA